MLTQLLSVPMLTAWNLFTFMLPAARPVPSSRQSGSPAIDLSGPESSFALPVGLPKSAPSIDRTIDGGKSSCFFVNTRHTGGLYQGLTKHMATLQPGRAKSLGFWLHPSISTISSAKCQLLSHAGRPSTSNAMRNRHWKD